MYLIEHTHISEPIPHSLSSINSIFLHNIQPLKFNSNSLLSILSVYSILTCFHSRLHRLNRIQHETYDPNFRILSLNSSFKNTFFLFQCELVHCLILTVWKNYISHRPFLSTLSIRFLYFPC